jgi:ABC-type phosphate transport system substrate-binding protein
MTREPSYIELDGYQQMIQGQTPLQIKVMRGRPNAQRSLSPLVLVVNSANPLTSVDIPKLKALFTVSQSTAVLAPGLWQDLGVKGSRGRHRVHLYGFDTESDEAVTFSLAVLGNNPRWTCYYKALLDTPNVATQISQEVEHDIDGLGLTTLDAVGPHTKVLEIAASGGAVSPTPEALGSGDYVLGRTVFALARRTSDGNAEPAVGRFLAFLSSDQGQAILRSDRALRPFRDSPKTDDREALK